LLQFKKLNATRPIIAVFKNLIFSFIFSQIKLILKVAKAIIFSLKVKVVA